MIFTHSTLLNNFKNLTHAYTNKNSGNIAFHVNDDTNLVIQNHIDLAKDLQYIKPSLIHMKQTHSDIVHIVNDEDNFQNVPTCDALITNKIDTPLMVMVADCSPILFYDDVQKVIAVAHAGRAGAFRNIVKNVIDSFVNNFNSEAKNIYVSVGPNIKKCCYEVGGEINEEVKNLNLQYAIEPKKDKFYLDIDKIIKTQLLEAGIKSSNIELSGDCTSCHSDTYFSYRVDNKTGRFSGIIKLNS